MRNITFRFTLLLLFYSFILHTCYAKSNAIKAIPFALKDVKLTEGAFLKSQQLNEKWLKEINPDALLSGYRTEAGLTPKAPKYGGWESNGLSGHSMGHYLSALSLTYASTGDTTHKNKVIYIANELAECQKANKNGFIAGFPNANKVMFQIFSGDIQATPFDINGAWVPYYNLHKVFAGLIDAYNYTESAEVKSVLVKLSDWFYDGHNKLTDEQIQKILICEHGGVNEALMDISVITGDKKFSQLSFRFNHKAILEPLSKRIDDLNGKHANTQIPKIVGTAKQYLLTNNDTLGNISKFFYNEVVHNHSFCIGGNSSQEYFGIPGQLQNRITSGTCETCNTYNMLKLNKLLFMSQPSSELGDFYELALFNHIQAAQHPETGMFLYFSPLKTGSYKTDHKGFSSKFNSFWCCVGTGLESQSKYNDAIYFKTSKGDLIVNLFVPSTLNWTDNGLSVEQTTTFPEMGETELKLTLRKAKKMTLLFRIPSWTNQSSKIFVNGEIVKAAIAEGKFLSINRLWKNNDVIRYVIPMRISVKSIPGDSHQKALMYGPIVLSAELKENEYGVLACNDSVEKQVVKVSNHPLRFETKNIGEPADYQLLPYSQNFGKLAVYFNVFTKKDWKNEKESFLLKNNLQDYLEKNTIDLFRLGEMQPERDHNFKGENLLVGERMGKKIRETKKDGWMEFNMGVNPVGSNHLRASFYGNNGSRLFDIIIENQLITTEVIHWMGYTFIDKEYDIPQHLTNGKKSITVKFVSKGDGLVAPVTEVRTLRY